ncbi:MAG: 5-formyltetrahydrofolate cyclo-ligase [Myxococcota bacterium]
MTLPPKRTLRRSLKAARAALTPERRAPLEARVAAHLRSWILDPGTTVAVYAALPAELSLDDWIESPGAALRFAYPRVTGPSLTFSEVSRESLVPGAKGILEPNSDAALTPLTSIDAFMVPGLGFTPDGRRLGYGGGFYDRILADHPRALRIGVAFELQVVPEIPIEPHDAQMDGVVTERGWRWVRRELPRP